MTVIELLTLCEMQFQQVYYETTKFSNEYLSQIEKDKRQLHQCTEYRKRAHRHEASFQVPGSKLGGQAQEPPAFIAYVCMLTL
jgi:hypothetical protein